MESRVRNLFRSVAKRLELDTVNSLHHAYLAAHEVVSLLDGLLDESEDEVKSLKLQLQRVLERERQYAESAQRLGRENYDLKNPHVLADVNRIVPCELCGGDKVYMGSRVGNDMVVHFGCFRCNDVEETGRMRNVYRESEGPKIDPVGHESSNQGKDT